MCTPSPSVAAGDEWTTGDTIRQAAFTTLVLIDWKQTRDIKNHPDMMEKNKLLGAHPSDGRVDATMVTALIGHAAIAYVLPRGWRDAWQYVWIGVEADTVAFNRSIGLRINF